MAREMGPEEEIARQEIYNKFMARFDKLSSWRREKNADGSIGISREVTEEKTGEAARENVEKKIEKFRLERLRYPEGKEDAAVDKKVEGSHQLLVETFKEDEVDSLETTITAMKGQVVGDTETADIPLIVTNAENEKGEVVGTTHSAILEAYDRDFTGKGKSFAIDAYTAIDTGEQNKKLGLEMFRHRLEVLIAEAEEQHKPLDSIVAEVHSEAEGFYNKVGLKRLYFRGEDQKMHEVPYYQSVLADAWNKQTGRPKKEGERVPEHLMIGQLDGRNEITTEELLEKIRAMMDYNNIQTKGYFGKNTKAYEAHLKILKADLKELEDILPKDGRIALLSAEERNEMLGFDKDLFLEHTAADKKK